MTDKKAFMPAPELGRSFRKGLGVNLLMRDVDEGVRFARDVLGATILHADQDFAAIRYGESVWMLHRDQTYRGNVVLGLVDGLEGRGAGIELRVYGCLPDDAEARARASGFTVLAGSIDKPHGLRECVILDHEGYAWVPGIGIPDKTG
jgi:catechol 2,3-dioxygenase-like lactoylglutathione lyase family enzyme